MCREKRFYLIAILLLFSLTIYTAIPLSADSDNEFEITNAYWRNSSGQRIPVTGGDEAYLTLEIRQSNPSDIEYTSGSSTIKLNRPPVAISGVTVELLGSDWYEILGNPRYDVQTTIPVGNVFTVEFHVKIREDVKPGNYSGRIRISYSLAYDGNRWYVVNQSEIDTFNIRITGKPELDAEIKGNILSGKSNNITLTITNTGDACSRDGEVSLSTQAPLDIKPDKITFQEICGGRKADFVFNVTAPYNYQQSTIQFIASVKYLAPDDTTITKQWTLNLISTKPPTDYPILEMSLETRSSLIPNLPTQAVLAITNVGRGEAVNVNIGLMSQSLYISPQNLPLIQELDPNQTVRFTLTLKPSSQAMGGIAVLQVTGSYIDNKGAYRQVSASFSEPIEIQSAYSPRVSVKIEPNLNVPAGNKTILYLKIEDKGPTPLYNVSLTASSQSLSVNLPLDYVDFVNEGESYLVPIEIETPYTLKGRIAPLSVQITYNDITGATNTIQRTFTIKVLEKTPTPNILIKPLTPLVVGTGLSQANLLIENRGDAAAKDVVIEFTAQGGISIIENSTLHIAKLSPGKKVNAIILLSSTLPGSYSIPVNIEYKDPWYNIHHATITLGIRVVEKPDTSIDITLPQNSVAGGRPSKINITLEAVNGDAHNVWVKASSATISVIGSPVRFIPLIKEGETSTFQFDVYAPQQLVGSPSTFSLTISYITEKGEERIDTYTLTLLVAGEVRLELLDYSIYPQTPHPGDEIGITASLVNKGTDTARQVTSYLTKTGGMILIGGNRTFIGDAGVGSIIPVSYSLKIPEDTPPGEKKVEVTLEYKDSFNLKHSYVIEIPVNITSAPITMEKKSSLGTGVAKAGIIAIIVAIAGLLTYYWKFRRA